MHFSRLAIVALPVLGAVASVLPRTNDCSGGTMQCCQQCLDSNSLPAGLSAFFALIGVSTGSIGPNVGLTCTAIVDVINQPCQSNTVCCTGNNYQHGGININTGCTPVIL